MAPADASLHENSLIFPGAACRHARWADRRGVSLEDDAEVGHALMIGKRVQFDDGEMAVIDASATARQGLPRARRRSVRGFAPEAQSSRSD